MPIRLKPCEPKVPDTSGPEPASVFKATMVLLTLKGPVLLLTISPPMLLTELLLTVLLLRLIVPVLLFQMPPPQVEHALPLVTESKRIRIASAVISEVRVGDPARCRDSCCVRDGALGRCADRAGGLVSEFAAGRHRDGVVDITAAGRGKTGRPPALRHRKRHTRKNQWEIMRHVRPVNTTRSRVDYLDAVGVFLAGRNSSFEVTHRNLEIGR